MTRQLAFQLMNLGIEGLLLRQPFGDSALVFARILQLLIARFNGIRLRDAFLIFSYLFILPLDLCLGRLHIGTARIDTALQLHQAFALLPQQGRRIRQYHRTAR